MQEFFEAWANAGFMKGLMATLGEHALGFSIFMITLEVVVGLALLIGWQKKMVTWILFLLILFFTFLTSYVLFSGKIKACGCFGDCIPLTPIQTFSKDIALLLLSVLLLFNQKYIQPVAKPLALFVLIILATIATLFLQFYVMKHLPLTDCLPYKKGSDLLESRKMPANAVPDKFAISFIYQKNGLKKEFTAEALPDSSWEYVDRKQNLVKAGVNNIPLINDFSLTTASGNDSTDAILGQAGVYYILFIKELEGIRKNFKDDKAIALAAYEKGIPFYIVTARREMISSRYADLSLKGFEINVPVFTCDATAIKTAARADIVLYKMKGPVVQEKWGWADFDKVVL
jgi:uncharacterized membrane protein YphA (DoxX/SURF4 family)